MVIVETVASAAADPARQDGRTFRLIDGSVASLEPDGLLVYEAAARELRRRSGRHAVRADVAGLLSAHGCGDLLRSPTSPAGCRSRSSSRASVYLDRVRHRRAGHTRVREHARRRGDGAAVDPSARCGDDFPNIEVLTRDEYRDDQQRAIDRFLAVTVALLLLSEIIAVLGIVNTLALSVFERTQELGLLRAVGMSRAQVRRMVRGEAVIIACIGGGGGRRGRAAVGLGVHHGTARPGDHLVRRSRWPQFDRVPRGRGRGRGDRRMVPCTSGEPSRRARRDRHRVAGEANSVDVGRGPAATLIGSNRAVSSGVEHFPDTEGVRGSNPLPPTRNTQVSGGKCPRFLASGGCQPARRN